VAVGVLTPGEFAVDQSSPYGRELGGCQVFLAEESVDPARKLPF
jgi:hypothetical protein